MVLHCGQGWAHGCEGGPCRVLPLLLEGSQQVPSRWMLLARLGTGTAPFCSRTQGILGKHHDFLPRKCLLPELPPLGTLTCGIGGTLFSDIRPLYSTRGADALAPAQQHRCEWWPLAQCWCHLSTWQLFRLLPTVCHDLPSSYSDFNQAPSQYPAHTMSLVPLLWLTGLIALSLLLLPWVLLQRPPVYTLDR